MIMKILENQKTVKTDEEYKAVLKGRQKILIFMGIIGAITLGLGAYLGYDAEGKQASFLCGVYSGIGAALLAVAVVRCLKIRRLLRDARKIREARLAAQDERTAALTQRALSMAGLVAVGFAYVGLLIAGFFSMTVFWTLWVLIIVYFVSMIFLCLYYNKKM